MLNKRQPMIRLLAAACLMAGCGPSPPTEPAQFVADEVAEPIAEIHTPTAVSATSAPTPPEKTFVQQAAFQEESTEVPPVLLTAQHEALCHVNVGDTMPEIELPKIGGGRTKLSDLYGSAATVVVFWSRDRRMALDELADLGPDVVETFGSRGVTVVGIAVKESSRDAQAALRTAEAKFANLLDADGSAFAEVGSQKLPRTLLLDAKGKVVWFDIEYSHATRRELQRALLATLR